MTSDEIWQRLVDRTPKLADPGAKVQFTAAGLKRLVEQVCSQCEKPEPRREFATTESVPDFLRDIVNGR